MSAALHRHSLSSVLKSTHISRPILSSLSSATPSTQINQALLRLSATSKAFSSAKTMSASAPTKEWLVQIPDHPNALEKRLAVRQKHLDNLKPKIDAGIVVFGGAMLSKHPNEGEGPDMTGSIMLIKANTETDVREFLENDQYTKGGAWNPKEAKIYPFKCAVRTAL